MMRRLLILFKNIFKIPIKIKNHISPFTVIQNSIIDKHASLSSGVKFYRSKIGRYSYVSNNSFVSDVEIGNFTSISSNCYIGGASHPIDWISTSPVFHRHENRMNKNFSDNDFDIFKRTVIGNDVWIGNGVIIKAGVSIGDGAIVGMGSVVTKDIGDFEIWAGDPAKFIRLRFDDKIIDLLKEKKWWYFSDEKILKYGNYFNDVKNIEEIIK